jgi:co-chaperonin GroES (HSP10)
MNYEPLANLIVILVDDDEKKSGSIIIPDTAGHGMMQTGTVKAAGPGFKSYGIFVDTVCKPGDRVIFQRGSGSVLDLTEKLVIMRESDVLCKIVQA